MSTEKNIAIIKSMKQFDKNFHLQKISFNESDYNINSYLSDNFESNDISISNPFRNANSNPQFNFIRNNNNSASMNNNNFNNNLNNLFHLQINNKNITNELDQKINGYFDREKKNKELILNSNNNSDNNQTKKNIFDKHKTPFTSLIKDLNNNIINSNLSCYSTQKNLKDELVKGNFNHLANFENTTNSTNLTTLNNADNSLSYLGSCNSNLSCNANFNYNINYNNNIKVSDFNPANYNNNTFNSKDSNNSKVIDLSSKMFENSLSPINLNNNNNNNISNIFDNNSKIMQKINMQSPVKIKNKLIIIDNKSESERKEKFGIRNETSAIRKTLPINNCTRKKRIFECLAENSNKIILHQNRNKIKKRFRKSSDQLKFLFETYKKNNKNWSKELITQVSLKTGLSENKVYKWFWDQKNKEILETKPAGCIFYVRNLQKTME